MKNCCQWAQQWAQTTKWDIWHCLPNWEGRTSGTHAKMLSCFLLLPLRHQNIPDGCIIYYSLPNIKNPALNSPPMSPAVSTPPNHCFWHCLHVFTSAPNPCATAPPYYTALPSNLAPSAYHLPYPLIQRNLLLILTNSSIMAILPSSFFFGWWASTAVDLWPMLGSYHLLIYNSGHYRWCMAVVHNYLRWHSVSPLKTWELWTVI